MRPLPLAALAAAAVLSTMIVLDILWNATHPDLGPWLDAEANPALVRFVAIAHVGLYTLLTAGLIRYGRVIDGGSAFVRVLRWIMIVAYGLFALLYSWSVVDPSTEATGVFGILLTACFAISLLLPIVLGFLLVRRRGLRLPALLLIAPVVVFPITLLLEAFTDWAHPGYMETVVNFGVALLCVAASEMLPPSGAEATENAAPAMETAVAESATRS